MTGRLLLCIYFLKLCNYYLIYICYLVYIVYNILHLLEQIWNSVKTAIESSRYSEEVVLQPIHH